MKKILFLLLPALLVFSCKNTETTNNDSASVETPVPQKVTLTGSITNPLSDAATLNGKDVEITAPLKEGKFAMEFELTEPTELSFGHGQERSSLYLEPGDAVTLTIDPSQFDETIQLAGKGAEESNFLLKKYLMREGFGEMKDIFSLSSEDFATRVDEMKNEIGKYLDSYSKEHPKMNADFVKTEKNNNMYTWAMNKMNYPNYYKYFTKNEAPDMGDNYLSFMDKIDLNNEKEFKSNRNYMQLIQSYVSQGSGDKKETADRLAMQFESINSKIKNSTIKSKLMYNFLSEGINYGSTKGMKPFITAYNNISTNEENKSKLADKYEKAMRLAKGAEAPTFAYTNTKEEVIDLGDLKGKNVYIDVWATWCGPCKAEIPKLKELEHKYANNPNIAFMSVSIDAVKDKDKWLKMIADKELGGIQLMGDKAWDSSICKDYLIQGIPRFILVDKNGKIIDKNAPRPSSDEIKEILADLSSSTQTSMK